MAYLNILRKLTSIILVLFFLFVSIIIFSTWQTYFEQDDELKALPSSKQESMKSNTSWPQVQYDANRSGYLSHTVGGPYEVLWRRSMVEEYTSDGLDSLFPISHRVQAIVADSLIFLPSNDKSLYALSASDGTTAWSYQTEGGLVNSAGYADGKVFFGSTDHYIYALNASDGSLVWRFETGSTVKTAPLLVDTKVIMGSSDGKMYALNQEDGTELWSYDIGVPIYDTAAHDNGKVFFGGMDSKVYAVNAEDGAEVWNIQIPAQGFRDRWTVAGHGKVILTPVLLMDHHIPLLNGTDMFKENPDYYDVTYNKGWAAQKAVILDYFDRLPYRQPVHVIDQETGQVAFTPPIMYASGGALSPHCQPVLLPNGNANIVYRRSFGEPARHGPTTNSALYTGELDLTTGDIITVDRCDHDNVFEGDWHDWDVCGTYKSRFISDESTGLMRTGDVIYQYASRGAMGLDTANETLIPFSTVIEGTGYEYFDAPVDIFPGEQNYWVVDYDNIFAELSSDGNDSSRPAAVVGDKFYILNYHTLVVAKGVIR